MSGGEHKWTCACGTVPAGAPGTHCHCILHLVRPFGPAAFMERGQPLMLSEQTDCELRWAHDCAPAKQIARLLAAAYAQFQMQICILT